MSLTRTRLRVAVRVMRYYNSVPLKGGLCRWLLLGAVQTTSLLVVMIALLFFTTGLPLFFL